MGECFMIFATLQTRLIAAGAAIIGVLAILLRVFYAGKNAEQVKTQKRDLSDAKEVIRQNNIVSGNDNVAGMRKRLSAAMRQKRNSDAP